MRNNTIIPDDNFLKIYPDLAVLFREIKQKEQALEKLKEKRKALKDELKSVKSELYKRINALESWQAKAAGNTDRSIRRRQQAS